jgi:hypothetical protein
MILKNLSGYMTSILPFGSFRSDYPLAFTIPPALDIWVSEAPTYAEKNRTL